MARLTGDVVAYIVQSVACFDYPSQVAKGVLDTFGIQITRQTVERYDPTKIAGKDLGKKWIELFHQARKQFLEDTNNIAISHKAVRMRRLERMAAKAEEMGAIQLAASLMEQAAKEMGEAYTNRHKLEHVSPDGTMTPAPALAIDTSKMSTAALKELIQATRGHASVSN